VPSCCCRSHRWRKSTSPPPVACCLFALFCALTSIRAQQRQIEKLEDECRDQRSVSCRKIEKLQDEYRGQCAINEGNLIKHKAAMLALERKMTSELPEETCQRAHYEGRDFHAHRLWNEMEETSSDLNEECVRLKRSEAKLQKVVRRPEQDKENLRVKVGVKADELER
jgi:hypothetical protein